MAEEKEKSGLEYIENPEALAEQISKSEEFIGKNKSMLGGVVVAIAALIAGVIYFQGSSSSVDQEAQLDLYPIQHYFSIDSLDRVLHGDGDAIGALDLADEQGGSKVGNLAAFYAGAAYLKKGEYDNAITYLNKFSSDDLLLQARAYSLVGDAYMEKNETANAVEAYKKAINYKPNEQFTPRYMIKLALAQEVGGQTAEAVKTYEKLLKDFPKSNLATDAKKYKAKAEAQLQVAQG